MVVVKLFGGLGNQLFQYSFGKYLANQLNTSVRFDVQTDVILSNFTPRGLGLSAFNIKIDLATNENINEMKFFSNGFFEKVERKVTQKFPSLRNTYFVESLSHRLIEPMFIRDNCYYEGYWQAYEYLTLNEKICFNSDILAGSNISGNQIELINEIKTTDSVSLHIRRGDYISIKVNSKIFQICTLDYYQNAIAFIEKKIENPVFFVFSDEIEWAKENLRGDNFVFVTGNEPSTDLYFMSLCKHNIIANSTFSWWGAWLNQDRNKIVIAPNQWYVGELNDSFRNLIPQCWIRI